MMVSLRRPLVLGFFVAAAFGLGVWLGAYLSQGATLIGMDTSPDGAERVEFYHATRWQRLFEPGADLLGIARLVRLAGDETLATSDAFELSGESMVIWSKDKVQVGSSAVFDRAAARWTVIR